MKVNLSENTVKGIKVVCTAGAVLVASILGWKMYKKQTSKKVAVSLVVSSTSSSTIEPKISNTDDQKTVSNEAELATI
jgi:hypothetical protein